MESSLEPTQVADVSIYNCAACVDGNLFTYIYGEVHVRLQRRVSEGFGVTRTYSVDLTQKYKSTVMLDLR